MSSWFNSSRRARRIASLANLAEPETERITTMAPKGLPRERFSPPPRYDPSVFGRQRPLRSGCRRPSPPVEITLHGAKQSLAPATGAGPNGGSTIHCSRRTFTGRLPRASDRFTPAQTRSPETRMDGQARHAILITGSAPLAPTWRRRRLGPAGRTGLLSWGRARRWRRRLPPQRRPV